jgi:hypothetical protein
MHAFLFVRNSSCISGLTVGMFQVIRYLPSPIAPLGPGRLETFRWLAL